MTKGWPGIWGGQLQCWTTGKFVREDYEQMEASGDKPAIGPRVPRLTKNMHKIDGDVQEIVINDDDGKPINADNHDRHFFEAAWVHKHNGKYYFSYSTGDTHFLAHADGDSPLGPFTYAGKILDPVQGWTTHRSIVEFKSKW